MKFPPYNIFPNLSGNRISLRQIRTADIKDLVEISFYDSVPATTVEQAIEMQAKIDRNYIDGNSILWGISDQLTNKVVGTCGYYRGLDKGEGKLGCVLLPQFCGHGLMTSAMLLAIEFGLSTTIGLKRIWAVTSQQNKDAIKFLERLNFMKIADLNDNEIEYELRLK